MLRRDRIWREALFIFFKRFWATRGHGDAYFIELMKSAVLRSSRIISKASFYFIGETLTLLADRSPNTTAEVAVSDPQRHQKKEAGPGYANATACMPFATWIGWTHGITFLSLFIYYKPTSAHTYRTYVRIIKLAPFCSECVLGRGPDTAGNLCWSLSLNTLHFIDHLFVRVLRYF